jgi:hypothetical protein
VTDGSRATVDLERVFDGSIEAPVLTTAFAKQPDDLFIGLAALGIV